MSGIGDLGGEVATRHSVPSHYFCAQKSIFHILSEEQTAGSVI